MCVVKNQLAELELVKKVEPAGSAEVNQWNLSATGPTLSGVTRNIDNAAGGTSGFVPVFAGQQYTLSETGTVDGFTNGTTWVCTGDGISFTQPNLVTVPAGKRASCEITNTRGASLDVEKTSVGGVGPFDFATVSTPDDGAALPASFTRTTTAENVPTANAPFGFTASELGTKFVTETVPAGWTLTNIVCTAGGAEISIGTGTGADFVGNAGFDAGDTTVRAVITAGDTPSLCVFTNTRGASLDVEKTSVGGVGPFDFATVSTPDDGAALPASFTRTTTAENVPTANAPFGFTASELGTKFVTETVPAGWTLTNIVCTAGGAEISIGTGTGADFVGNAGFDAGGTTVRAVITAGDTPSCVFTNTRGASLDVEKTSVGGVGPFDFVTVSTPDDGAALPASFTRTTTPRMSRRPTRRSGSPRLSWARSS